MTESRLHWDKALQVLVAALPRWSSSFASLGSGPYLPNRKLDSLSPQVLAIYGVAKQALSTPLVLGAEFGGVKWWGCCLAFPINIFLFSPHQPHSEVHQICSPRTFENWFPFFQRNTMLSSIYACFVSNEANKPHLLETPCGRRPGPLSAAWLLTAEFQAAPACPHSWD